MDIAIRQIVDAYLGACIYRGSASRTVETSRFPSLVILDLNRILAIEWTVAFIVAATFECEAVRVVEVLAPNRVFLLEIGLGR